MVRRFGAWTSELKEQPWQSVNLKHGFEFGTADAILRTRRRCAVRFTLGQHPGVAVCGFGVVRGWVRRKVFQKLYDPFTMRCAICIRKRLASEVPNAEFLGQPVRWALPVR